MKTAMPAAVNSRSVERRKIMTAPFDFLGRLTQ